MKWRVGDRVLQRVYGAGDVVDVNPDYITISFDTGGTRKFATRLVRLEPTSIPRPPRLESVGRPRKRGSTVRSGGLTG